MRTRNNGPEAQKAREDLRKWRTSASMSAFAPVRQKFTGAGMDLRLLCFNMNESFTDDEFEYVFQVAKALGAKAITTSTQVTVSKRVAPSPTSTRSWSVITATTTSLTRTNSPRSKALRPPCPTPSTTGSTSTSAIL